jgi:Ca-activated chloride channel family protein
MDFSFATPLALLGLLAIPVLVISYLGTMARRRRIAAEFSNPVLAASVSPTMPGFRRHVPVLLLFVGVSILLVAMARPQRTVAVPVERAQIMLVTDVSGSMLSKDVEPNRLKAAQAAAQRFLKEVPDEVNVGIMAFNQVPRVLQSPTTDRDALRDAIGQYQAGGGTATGDAIIAALRTLGRTGSGEQTGPPSAIVLLSDGVSTKGSDPIEAATLAKESGTPISTVTLGTETGTITVPRPRGAPGFETRKVPPDPETLQQIAKLSGGRAYDASSASDLSSVYKELGSQLGRREERRDLTAGFAGVAGLIALCGAALSLRWFGRLA